ncbi:zinc finger protein CONSTANS-LIKE 16-like, partial [Phalaenopsis equestris]|uniref:zinc finger protein CONSTANS-LIKE 16-like n=1 Tax=Phalaenopsis equestris TaxID=78828 RepID=UPI0009E5F3EF
TSSSSSSPATASSPAWHHGFKRKARTPRSHHKPLVPELESSVEEEEEEEQLLYRVPVLDPALAFGETPAPPPPPQPKQQAASGAAVEAQFAPTEIELAEFAANMESLLGRGLDGGEAFCMEELGLGDVGSTGRLEMEVKGEVEEEKEGEGEGLSFELEVDLSRETLELDFGCGPSEMKEEEKEVSKGMGLRLDYEAVKEAWQLTGSSLWMSGERPRLGAEDYWLECLGMWGRGGELVGGGGGIQAVDIGREARVTRYREKRRTRLFSKKIRYEVRKLNAEKRPRMKGRFVKRASFPATSADATAGGGPVGVSCWKGESFSFGTEVD